MPILNGWKKVMDFCGTEDRKTILKWVNEYKLPVVIIGGKITACTENIILWHSELQKNSPLGKIDRKPHELSPKDPQRIPKGSPKNPYSQRLDIKK